MLPDDRPEENDMDTELRAMFDRDAIRQCIVRLARGEDRRDAALLRASFRADAKVDFGVFAADFETYLGWVVPGAEAITNTQHVLGQSFIELDGDSAKAETHVVSYHRVEMGEGERDTCIGGRYLDVFTHGENGWRVAERTMLYDWYQDWGPSIDWAQGVMGLPLSAPHYAGRAHGDFSAAFFG
jgi:SnoaL-like domain